MEQINYKIIPETSIYQPKDFTKIQIEIKKSTLKIRLLIKKLQTVYQSKSTDEIIKVVIKIVVTMVYLILLIKAINEMAVHNVNILLPEQYKLNDKFDRLLN